jgi:hypothetical protein
MIGPFNCKARLVKNVFCYYEPFRSRLASKFAKNLIFKKFNMNTRKNPKFDAVLELAEKVAKKPRERISYEKVMEKGVFYVLLISAYIFLSVNFLHFFSTDSKSSSNFASKDAR